MSGSYSIFVKLETHINLNQTAGNVSVDCGLKSMVRIFIRLKTYFFENYLFKSNFEAFKCFISSKCL